MPEIKLNVGKKLFEFSSFDDWCEAERDQFEQAGLRAASIIAVDAKGRVCRCGREFVRAREEGTFPVQVFDVLTPE